MPSGSYLHVDPHDGTPVAQEEFSCAAGPLGWRYVATVRDPDGRVTGRIDLTLDGGGRQVQVVLTAGSWELRGGVAGRETLWVRRPSTAVRLTGGPTAVGPASGGGGPAAIGDRVASSGLDPDRGPLRDDDQAVARRPTSNAGPASGGGESASAEGLAGAEERAEEAAGFAGRSPAFLVATARLLRLRAGARARLRLVEVTEPALGTRLAEQGWSLEGVTSYPTETEPLPLARYRVTDLATGLTREVHLAGDVVVAASHLELTDLRSPPSL